MGACCSDEKKAAVVNLDAPTTEEQAADYAHAEADGVEDTECEAAAIDVQVAIPETAKESPEKEDATEKARLQVLVSEFAKQAVQGCPCILIDENSGEQKACEYRLENNLEKLRVSLKGNEAEVLAEIPVASIKDIYSHSGDGAAAFDPAVLRGASTEEHNLLAMVVYEQGAKGSGKLVLLEKSAETLQTFLECMRVLVVYARARVEAP